MFPLYIKQSGQWIGEEGLVSASLKLSPEDEEFPPSQVFEEILCKLNQHSEVSYSAVCKSKVDVYTVSKLNFTKRFPKEIHKQLTDAIGQRQKFIYERV